MNRILLGVILGILFGVLDVLLMIPLKVEDRRTAMLGAFTDRFAIGVLIGATTLPVSPWLQGLIVGLLVSLPSAIITRAYAPILIIGGVGSIIIGLIVGQWGI